MPADEPVSEDTGVARPSVKGVKGVDLILSVNRACASPVAWPSSRPSVRCVCVPGIASQPSYGPGLISRLRRRLTGFSSGASHCGEGSNFGLQEAGFTASKASLGSITPLVFCSR